MGKLRRATAAALLLSFSLLLLSSTAPTAGARPVVGLRAVDLSSAAAVPAAGVALPKEALGRPDELHRAHQINGCGDIVAPAAGVGGGGGGGAAASEGETLGELYGPLLLNLLPRGPAPPSAPSTGTNDDRT